MAVLDDVMQLIPTLRGSTDDACDFEELRTTLLSMSDADVVHVVEETASIGRALDQIMLLASGVISLRSQRQAGHSGLAQSLGHSSASALLQNLTGSTKAEASRQARVGEQVAADDPVDAEDGSTLSGDPSAGAEPGVDGAAGDGGASGESGAGDGEPRHRSEAPKDWRYPLKRALRSGTLTQAQFDAISGGLGEPPRADDGGRAGGAFGRADGLDPGGASVDEDVDAGAALGAGDDERRRVLDAEAREAWAHAAEQLVDEAGERTVEELRAAARSIRDLLDPEGAEARFLARFERRAFRIWVDRDGQRRASIAFDDEGGAFYESIIAAALRPRRGGPRFVDAAEKQAAQKLIDDSRTNDQLAYDLFIDLIRAGTVADAVSVLGARQAGVRLVQKVDADGSFAPVAHTEDGLIAVPAASAKQRLCDTGAVTVTVDSCGTPLDVGRDQRLFTSRQRIALAIRDGGCRWRGCDRPASYCEAHHIDPWSSGGRTDVDRGILLCRFHHMNLHHGGWWITRDETGDFVLHDPGGGTRPLRERAVLSYALNDLDPPGTRFRPAA